jgi:hypothetical protein
MFLAAQGGANDTPRGTEHMKKTLLAFLIVGLLVSTGHAKGRHGGRRHAGGTVSVRGDVRHDGTYVAPHDSTGPHETVRDNWSTKENVHPSTDQPSTKDPYGYMGGYSGGYDPWHSGHVDVNPSAVSSEMEAPQAGAAVQQRQDQGVCPIPYWSLYNDDVETQEYFWELSACLTQGNQRGQGYFFCQESSTGEVVVAQPASVPVQTPVVTTSEEWVFYLDHKDTGFHFNTYDACAAKEKTVVGAIEQNLRKKYRGVRGIKVGQSLGNHNQTLYVYDRSQKRHLVDMDFHCLRIKEATEQTVVPVVTP